MRALSVVMALAVVFAVAGYGEQRVVERIVGLEEDKLHLRDYLWYEIDSEEPFTGTLVEYFPRGQKWWEVEYRDGKRHGKTTGWHSNGQKMVEGESRDGGRHGKWTYWRESGQKVSEWEYLDGKRHGKWTEWHPNGQKESEVEYRDGKLIKAECWDKDGNPRPCPDIWDEEKQRFMGL